MFHNALNRLGKLRGWTVGLLGAVCLVLAACGGQPTATTGIASAWTGKVDGTDAYIALASNGTELMAYVCDSQSVAQWFHGEAGKDKLDLVAGTVDLSSDTATLVATLTLDSASGTVTLADGQAHTFTATKATGDGGLYRSEQSVNNETLIGGWVVLNGGDLRGAQVNLSTGEIQQQLQILDVAKIIGPTIPRY